MNIVTFAGLTALGIMYVAWILGIMWEGLFSSTIPEAIMDYKHKPMMFILAIGVCIVLFVVGSICLLLASPIFIGVHFIKYVKQMKKV